MTRRKIKIEVVKIIEEDNPDIIPIIPEFIEEMIERDFTIRKEEHKCRSSMNIYDKIQSLKKLEIIKEQYKNVPTKPIKQEDIELYKNIKSIKTKLQSILWSNYEIKTSKI